MAPSYPSIQSFYKREIPKPDQKQPNATDNPTPPNGDGFTEKELEEALDPLSRPWNPEREYDETTIDQLIPGPKAVTFIGRIVNFNTVFGRSAKQPKAAGWHYIIVKDNAAAISLKLYFARKDYPLKLGQLVSVWTAFISDMTKAETSANTTTFANLFPGRNTSDHVMIHTRNNDDMICTIPLEYKKGQPLPGLMTLESYLAGGHEVLGAKILVCVKSIGAKRKVTIKKTSLEKDLCEVMLFDHTGEVKFSLWGELYEAAKEWQPSVTVLLISNPQFKLDYGGKGAVSVLHSTMVESNPDFPDAEWLRKYAVGRTKKESLCLEFPRGVFDVDAAVYGIYRTFFTLAEVDEWVRDDLSQIFTGWINVTILELSLLSYYRRKMLLGAECCGLPTFSNSPTTPCPHCTRPLILSLNTRIIGPLIDETGCIATGKLVWSPQAWEDLFGRTMTELGQMAAEEIRYLEQRCTGLRCHLCFGWDERVGRLAVLAMRP